MDPKVNDKFIAWVEKKYGDPKIRKVKAIRGKKHDYLAINLDYSMPGEVKLDMVNYVTNMVKEFPMEYSKTKIATPANNKLFNINPNSKKLDDKRAEQL